MGLSYHIDLPLTAYVQHDVIANDNGLWERKGTGISEIVSTSSRPRVESGYGRHDVHPQNLLTIDNIIHKAVVLSDSIDPSTSLEIDTLGDTGPSLNFDFGLRSVEAFVCAVVYGGCVE